jgi:hypothetical protein
MGLTIRRIDILSLTKKDVPTSQIEKVFGPKISKNGYDMIEKFLLRWYRVFLNFTKGSWGSTK